MTTVKHMQHKHYVICAILSVHPAGQYYLMKEKTVRNFLKFKNSNFKTKLRGCNSEEKKNCRKKQFWNRKIILNFKKVLLQSTHTHWCPI